MSGRVLHIASWYPNPWDDVEGNFVRDQIAIFKKEKPAETIVVQVRPASRSWPRFTRALLEGDARAYILQAPLKPGSRLLEWISTLLLIAVLLRERAWRFQALHFHIAYPLLIHFWLWRPIIRVPIFVSEHWTAYHFNFFLPCGSAALKRIKAIFHQGFPVFAVSEALLCDIREFAKGSEFKGFVLPNVVALHGAREREVRVPTLFVVNVWRRMKNPMPMLEGLNRAAEAGEDFNLVIGGYGELIEEMSTYIEGSRLQGRTSFTGKLNKPEIANYLANSDGYLFSSNYETFSIACAEALGAGVPLIGPHISAITEYAGPEVHVEVAGYTPEAWHEAIVQFIARWRRGEWDRSAIARGAEQAFSEDRLRADYRTAMIELGLVRAE